MATTAAPAGPSSNSKDNSSSSSSANPDAAAAGCTTAAGCPPGRPQAPQAPQASPPAAAAAAAAVPRMRPSVSSTSIISLVPSEAHCRYHRHLLVAIDNSSNSVNALQWTLNHMYRPGDKLHLVHIIPEPPTLHPWPGVYLPPDDALELQEFKEASAMVQAAFAPLITRQAVPCDAHLIVAPQDPGSIVNILLDKQQELGAAALVVAPTGKSGLSEWWVGSVSKGLLQHSSVPVVLVPPSN